MIKRRIFLAGLLALFAVPALAGLQFSTTVRNAILDQIETTIGTTPVLSIITGSVPANCAAADGGSVLATLTLASDWMANASGGVKAFSNTPLSLTAGATGVAAHFRLFASDGTTCEMQGTVTASGGGGDLQLGTTTINSGDNVSITSWTITAPGA